MYYLLAYWFNRLSQRQTFGMAPAFRQEHRRPLPLLWVSRRVVLGTIGHRTHLAGFRYRCRRRSGGRSGPFSGTAREPTDGGGAGHGGCCFRPRGGDVLDCLPSPLAGLRLVPYAAKTEEKLVALSFDDGPNEPYTSRLLDTLDDVPGQGDVLPVGRCAQRFPSCTRRVVQSGHVLGNHSYSHSFTSYLKQPRQEIEINLSQEVFYSITGLTPALYRPPWLCHWPWVLRVCSITTYRWCQGHSPILWKSSSRRPRR